MNLLLYHMYVDSQACSAAQEVAVNTIQPSSRKAGHQCICAGKPAVLELPADRRALTCAAVVSLCAGIVIGAIVALLLVAAAIVLCCCSRPRSEHEKTFAGTTMTKVPSSRASTRWLSWRSDTSAPFSFRSNDQKRALNEKVPPAPTTLMWLRLCCRVEAHACPGSRVFFGDFQGMSLCWDGSAAIAVVVDGAPPCMCL